MKDRSRRFMAYSLIVVGGLMTTLCGLCSLSYAGQALLGWSSDYGPMMLFFVVVIGAPPTLLGLFLLRTGLNRRNDPP